MFDRASYIKRGGTDWVIIKGDRSEDRLPSGRTVLSYQDFIWESQNDTGRGLHRELNNKEYAFVVVIGVASRYNY